MPKIICHPQTFQLIGTVEVLLFNDDPSHGSSWFQPTIGCGSYTIFIIFLWAATRFSIVSDSFFPRIMFTKSWCPHSNPLVWWLHGHKLLQTNSHFRTSYPLLATSTFYSAHDNPTNHHDFRAVSSLVPIFLTNIPICTISYPHVAGWFPRFWLISISLAQGEDLLIFRVSKCL